MQNHPISNRSSDFPSDVLKWTKANAQPKMALKMMKICKYFQYRHFPYFVVKDLRGRNFKLEYLPLDYVKDPKRRDWRFWHFGEKWRELDIPCLENKLWISETFYFEGSDELLHLLLSKIAVCDAKQLFLKDLNDITFENFKVLTSSGNVQELTLENTVIKDEDGDAVPLEDLLQCLPPLVDLKIQGNFPLLIERYRSKLVIRSVETLTLKQFKLLISGTTITSLTLRNTEIKDENGVVVPLMALLDYLPELGNLKILEDSPSLIEKMDDQIRLENVNNFTIIEFKLLAAIGEVRRLTFKNTKIIDENGISVPLENVLQCLPKLEKLTIVDHPLCEIEANDEKILLRKVENFTLHQFKLLAAFGKVQRLTLDNTVIKDENGVSVQLKDVLRCLPNLKYLTIQEDSPSMIEKTDNQLRLENVDNLTINQFKILAAFGKVQKLTLKNTELKDENGIVVSYGNLLKYLPDIEFFGIEDDTTNSYFYKYGQTLRLYKVDYITFNEFKLLFVAGNIVSLDLENTVIKHENGIDVSFVDLLNYLPTLKDFKMNGNSRFLIERWRCKLQIRCVKNFTMEQFKLLISGATITSLTLSATEIKDENGVVVLLTDLLDYLPKLEDFRIDDNRFSWIEKRGRRLSTQSIDDILFKQFKTLTGVGLITDMNLRYTVIIDENGVAVPLEDLLECLPKLKELRIDDYPRAEIEANDEEIVLRKVEYFTFHQFKLLAAFGKIRRLTLDNALIKDENGVSVPLEDVLQCLPNLKYLTIRQDPRSLIEKMGDEIQFQNVNNLTNNQFKLLAAFGTVRRLTFKNTKITDVNGTVISYGNLLKYLPKVEYLEIEDTLWIQKYGETLRLHNIDYIAVNEFKLLFAAGNIRVLDLKNTVIKDEDGMDASFADLLDFIPQLEDFTSFSYVNECSGFEYLSEPKLLKLEGNVNSFMVILNSTNKFLLNVARLKLKNVKNIAFEDFKVLVYGRVTNMNLRYTVIQDENGVAVQLEDLFEFLSKHENFKIEDDSKMLIKRKCHKLVLQRVKNVTFKQFKLLTSGSTVKSLALCDSIIKDDVSLKDLLECLPDLENLIINGCVNPIQSLPSNVISLQMFNFNDASLNQFKILMSAGTLKTLSLSQTTVKDDKNEPVSIEDIFDCLPNLEKLELIRSQNTLHSHLKATDKCPKNLHTLEIRYADESFNLEEFFKFMENHQNIHFTFLYPSNNVQIDRLQTLTDILVKTWSPKSKPPNIKFNGMICSELEKINAEI